MLLIQPVLVAALTFVFVLLVVSVRIQAVGRILSLFLFAAGIVFILQPETANTAAHLLGVNRGADLFLYLFGVFAMYAFVRIYARQRRIERRLTELTRSLSIDQGRAPAGGNEAS